MEASRVSVPSAAHKDATRSVEKSVDTRSSVALHAGLRRSDVGSVGELLLLIRLFIVATVVDNGDDDDIDGNDPF